MATITYCDICKKRKADGEEWSSISLHMRGSDMPKLKTFWPSVNLCPKCGKIILPKIIKLLKIK